jgi:hypothetical protein
MRSGVRKVVQAGIVVFGAVFDEISRFKCLSSIAASSPRVEVAARSILSKSVGSQPQGFMSYHVDTPIELKIGVHPVQVNAVRRQVITEAGR